MESGATAKASSREATSHGRAGAARESTLVTKSGTPIRTVAIVAAAPVIGVATVPVIGPWPAVVAPPVVAVEPGSGSNEDAAHKPVRTVVTIGSASIWIVSVVSVCTNRSRTVINGPANADGHADLRLCIAAEGKEHQAEQCCVLEISHLVTVPVRADLAGWPVCFPACSPGEAAYTKLNTNKKRRLPPSLM